MAIFPLNQLTSWIAWTSKGRTEFVFEEVIPVTITTMLILLVVFASNNKTYINILANIDEYQTITSMQYEENNFCVLLGARKMNEEREKTSNTGINNWISI